MIAPHRGDGIWNLTFDYGVILHVDCRRQPSPNQDRKPRAQSQV